MGKEAISPQQHHPDAALGLGGGGRHWGRPGLRASGDADDAAALAACCGAPSRRRATHITYGCQAACHARDRRTNGLNFVGGGARHLDSRPNEGSKQWC